MSPAVTTIVTDTIKDGTELYCKFQSTASLSNFTAVRVKFVVTSLLQRSLGRIMLMSLTLFSHV